jgi:hypothetical protein
MRLEINNLRPCIIYPSKKKGLLHGIFQESEIYKPSLMVGGHNGGVVANSIAVVEVEGGQLIRVNPFDLKMLDDKFAEYDFSYEEKTDAKNNGSIG